MFGFLKRSKAEKDPRWGDYAGEGIWHSCPDCGALHEIDLDPGFDALLQTLCSDYRESCQALYEKFDFLGTGGRWDVIPSEGLFKMTNAQGRVAHCQYGIAASWNAQSHSWMWGWAFPEEWAMPEVVLTPARRLLERAEAEEWEAATHPILAVNEHEAWHLTNLTAHVMGWPLAYRAPVNDLNTHYFVLSEPHWAN